MDFRGLLEALLPKAFEWYSIGLQLGLDADELDTIEADSKGVEQCLRKVLRKWHSRTPHPTWQVVIAALRSPLVGEPALAKKLEDRMVGPGGKDNNIMVLHDEKEKCTTVNRARGSSTPTRTPPQASKGTTDTIIASSPVPHFPHAGRHVAREPGLNASAEYYDIVLVGETGQGKSTLGNKLLDLENTDESKIRSYSHTKKRFIQYDDPEVSEKCLSVTARCELLSNESTKIRVLDVPGFSGFGALHQKATISVYNGYLQIIRWIVREQIQYQLKVRRIIYFLPCRGPLLKADGTLQDELKALHHYFGMKIFNCMVVVATRIQEMVFDDDEIKEIKEVLHLALRGITGDVDIGCPPVIFIGLNDSSDEVLHKIQTALVLKESILPLEFTDEVCARCSLKILSNIKGGRVYIVDADTPYKESKCHAPFVPKYSGAEKFFGGAAHVATLGIGLFFERYTNAKGWPGFTNSDEICEVCKSPPGSEGCTRVGQEVTIHSRGGRKTLTVEHSNIL